MATKLTFWRIAFGAQAPERSGLPSEVWDVGPAGGHAGFAAPVFESADAGGVPCCEPAGAVRAFGFGAWAHKTETETESAMKQAIGPFKMTFCMQSVS